VRVHCVQHVPFEGPAAIAGWCAERGHALVGVHPYRGERLPQADAVEALVVMGGPMSANDDATLAWLADEKRFVERVLRAGRPILGVCLGAQILASVLGARVYRAKEREIGWWPLRVRREARAGTPLARWPETLVPLHWHGETFDLPAGAVHLAETDACPHQAFAHGRALGLQFHAEATPESVEEISAACAGEIGPGRFEQPAAEICAQAARCVPLRPLLFAALDALFARSEAR
jgi:GMP synthase-like glutamine amidotransferase